MVGSFNSPFFISFRFFSLDIIGLVMHHPKEGTKHFKQQRLTAVVNIVLGVIVFNFFINNILSKYIRSKTLDTGTSFCYNLADSGIR